MIFPFYRKGWFDFWYLFIIFTVTFINASQMHAGDQNFFFFFTVLCECPIQKEKKGHVTNKKCAIG